MNAGTTKRMSAGLPVILAVVVLWSGWLTPVQIESRIDPEIAESILHNTVQLRLFAQVQVNNQSDRGYQSYVMAQGLGSLVVWHGGTVIVTHNHWGTILSEAEYVQIMDAKGYLLYRLGMVDFLRLIIYRDPGTLVLAAPAGITSDIRLARADSTSVGDLVTLVHQAADNPDHVEVLQAQVARSKNYKGQSVYMLKLANGAQIIPGDSGGGIWLDGKLVGNIWASYLNLFKLPFSPNTSLFAPLPTILLAGVLDDEVGSLVQPSYNGPSHVALAK